MKLIHIEPTTRCNLRCAHCRLQADWWHGQDMDMEVALSVLNWIGRLPTPPRCILQGHGEPLVHPQYEWLFQEAADVCSEIEFQTSGVLLHRSIAERLHGAALGRWVRVKFSVDGPDGTVYGAMRPGADFTQVVRNIMRIHTLPAPRPGISIEYVVTRINVTSLMHMVEFASCVGADLLQFSLLSDWGLPASVAIPQEVALCAIGEACSRTVAGLRIVAPAVPAPVAPGTVDGCTWFNDALFVAVDGTVQPCCRLRESVGCVADSTLQQVLGGAKRAMFALGMGAHPVCSCCPHRGTAV